MLRCRRTPAQGMPAAGNNSSRCSGASVRDRDLIANAKDRPTNGPHPPSHSAWHGAGASIRKPLGMRCAWAAACRKACIAARDVKCCTCLDYAACEPGITQGYRIWRQPRDSKKAFNTETERGPRRTTEAACPAGAAGAGTLASVVSRGPRSVSGLKVLRCCRRVCGSGFSQRPDRGRCITSFKIFAPRASVEEQRLTRPPRPGQTARPPGGSHRQSRGHTSQRSTARTSDSGLRMRSTPALPTRQRDRRA